MGINFSTVIQAITISVCNGRIGSVDVDLGLIVQSITIGVVTFWVRTVNKLIAVINPIRLVIRSPIYDIRVASIGIEDFPAIRHTVAICIRVKRVSPVDINLVDINETITIEIVGSICKRDIHACKGIRKCDQVRQPVGVIKGSFGFPNILRGIAIRIEE